MPLPGRSLRTLRSGPEGLFLEINMKNVPWFSHDFNARDDEKIISMRMKHGWSSYGLYWAIIEMLRASHTYKLQTQYDSIAFALQSDKEIIRSIIESFDLFVVDGTTFFSKSLIERMLIKDEKSAEASKSAKIRWEKYRKNQQVNADALQTHSERNANAMLIKVSKDKVSKDKLNKNKDDIPPKIEDIEQYCKERNNNINAQKFFDYYESKGWVVGRSKMKSWKAAVRTWESNGHSKQKEQRLYNEI